MIACVFFVLMVSIGTIPGEAETLSDAFGDKLLHLCAYSFLTCMVFGGLPGLGASRVWRTIMTIGLLGALDEAIQSFMPYRDTSAVDWAFDILAAVLTLTILIFLGNTWRRMYQTPNRRVIQPAERPN